MGSTGKLSKMSDALMANLDSIRGISDHMRSVADIVEKQIKQSAEEFPDIKQITHTFLNDNMSDSAMASMNGLGFLQLNSNLFGDETVMNNALRRAANETWVVSDGSVESIIAHELGHNIDLQFGSYLDRYMPDVHHTVTVKDESMVEMLRQYNYIETNVGDVITRYGGNYDAKYISLDGVKYSRNDIGSSFSQFVVNKALTNIQNQWKTFGYQTQPTQSQLLKDLSGYSHDNYVKTGTYVEAFAEARSDYVIHGDRANILSHEINRITKTIYGQFKGKHLSKAHKQSEYELSKMMEELKKMKS